MNHPATSPDAPWPVRTVARKIAEWVDRLGTVWVEGQLTQVSAKPGSRTAFLTLRDPAADVSLSLTCETALVRDMQPPLVDGAQLVVHGKPSFYLGRGTLSLRIDDIRAVGIGELLARIEQLRSRLAAEGLFDLARKRALPLLPGRLGLITGRGSAAERDVLSNASARWPAAQFRVCNTAVQGPLAVTQIVDAVHALDRDPAVEVIVLARGGGSAEDLLAFSDETLCRAVAGCATPVVTAIGHETDTPLVDHVADLRCSTPTHAGRCVVPDLAEETAYLHQQRDRARRALRGWVDREAHRIDALRNRPVLAHPRRAVDERADAVAALATRSDRCVLGVLSAEAERLAHTTARLTALGPAATLQRGYAVVTLPPADGQGTDSPAPVVREPGQAPAGSKLWIRLARGSLRATVDDSVDAGQR